MIYDSETAERAAAEWNVDAKTISEWARRNYIPDDLALHLNLNKEPRFTWYTRLVRLLGDGWLKGEAICRHYGWHQTRLSDIVSYQRNPEGKKSRQLWGEEVDRIVTDFLLPLQSDVSSVIRRASFTPVDTFYPEQIQQELIALLHRPAVNKSRVRLGLSPAQSKKIENVMSGSRAPLHKLSDKPLLKAVLKNLEEMEALLNLTPESAPAPEKDGLTSQ